MADVSKLRKKGLGKPPSMDESATNLQAPELAPIPEIYSTSISTDSDYVRKDGRSARKTNRILAFATRVSPDFDREVRQIADREGLKLVEVLENAIQAYKEKQGY